MELIPILSLIILVATISTFILAVGAYILYKVRERKGVGVQTSAPSAIPAELVTPAPITTQQTTTERTLQPGRKTFEILQSPQQEYGYEYQQRQQTYTPGDVKGPELRPTFVSGTPESKHKKPTGDSRRYTDGQKYNEKKKFMRYTNEGYVEPTKPEKKQEDNLKWR